MFRHFSPKSHKKQSAQAMVEFALVLPILLLVIYGLIEAGRLIFIYATVVTASREAARYGSATGVNADGIPLYQDCTGIKAAAQKVGFLNTFNTTDIAITYDRDLGSTQIRPTPTTTINSTPGADTCFPAGYIVRNGDRIIVQVTTQFSPMLLIGTFSHFPITITTARSLLVSVAIGVAAPPGSSSSGLVLAITAPLSGSTFSSLGQVIYYTYKLTNNGTTPISGPFSVTDDHLSVSCPAATSLGPAPDAITCTGSYTITQTDLDTGSMTDQATASAPPLTSNPASVTITALQNPHISLTKSASPTVATTLGQQITYTYTLQNTGNVTLYGPYTITDNHINGGVAVPCVTATIVPAPASPNTTSCTKTYLITSADLTAGYVTNMATANTTTTYIGHTTVASNQASATVVTKHLYLTVTPSPTSASVLGQVITYTYTLYNNSTSSISGPFTITDNKINGGVAFTCATATLTAGGTTSCTKQYSVTQPDLDFGSIVNTATATGGGETSNPASTFVTLTQVPALTLIKGASPTTATTVGVTIIYTYTLKNTGNVTLKSPYAIADNKLGSISCTGATSPLAPAAQTTCSNKAYLTTQADLDAGSIINTATATAMFGTQTVTSNQASATVITFTAPRLKLQKTANPTSATGAGQTITYTYTLTNTGNTALTSPFTIQDDHINGGVPVTCTTATSPLNIGALPTTCTSSYTTTLADASAGSVTNTATAQAMAGAQTVTSNSASATVTVMTPSSCDIRHSLLKTAPFAMTIFSYPSTISIVHITSIQIYYNATGNSITQLSYGGVNIWSGTLPGSPGVFSSFTGDVSLSPSSNKILQVQFSSPYQPLTGGGERILVYFAEPGCPILDSSNAAQLP